MKEKIGFRDLSGWLKFAIIGGALYFTLFLFGIVLGIFWAI